MYLIKESDRESVGKIAGSSADGAVNELADQ